MLSTIQQAQKSVYLEMYIFEESTHGDFVSALIARATAGVRVVVILDALGSYNLATLTRERLIAGGVEVMFYRYWFHRTHRKLLVVDEAIAFVGGVNIAERFKAWDDLVIRVTGRVLPSIVHSFARAYVLCGGTDPTLTTHAQIKAVARAKTWFIEHGLGGKRYVLRQTYERSIDSARTKIRLVTPYFVPDGWLIAALGRALKRGVQIDIVVPVHTDLRSIDRLNRYYADMLRQLGARLYLYPTMMHAKAMVVDTQHAVVGSQNLDALSFGRNVEAGIFFEDASRVQELSGIIELWIHEAHEIVGTCSLTHWYDRLWVLILRVFTPVL
jgi:cardiolipin synthase